MKAASMSGLQTNPWFVGELAEVLQRTTTSTCSAHPNMPATLWEFDRDQKLYHRPKAPKPLEKKYDQVQTMHIFWCFVTFEFFCIFVSGNFGGGGGGTIFGSDLSSTTYRCRHCFEMEGQTQ
eukprot:4515408-Amphidinium_carterae.1